MVPGEWYGPGMIAALALLAWLYLLALHGRFWQSGPALAPMRPEHAPPVAIVVPARDEAEVIARSIGGHVHASEPQLLPVGTGGCNHQACAAALAQALPADTIITIEMLTRAAADPLAAIDAAVGVVVGTYGRGGER